MPQKRLDIVRPPAPEPFEVEAFGCRELVVARSKPLELLREPDEPVGVLPEEALRARISELEALSETGSLTAALAEVDRLRAALERSEEQLWEARGRLMADRERLEDLERLAHATAARGAQEVAGLLTDVLEEVASLESGLRAEVDQLAAVERALDEWRMAVGAEAAPPEAASPSAGES